jgi:hypothetical protein
MDEYVSREPDDIIVHESRAMGRIRPGNDWLRE